jgi:GAF domain-containing protein
MGEPNVERTGEGPFPRELAQSLAELSRLLLVEETLETTLERVARLTVKAIPTCDYGGVSLLTKRGISTAAASDPFTEQIDAIQYELDDGPCLSSIRDREIVEAPSLASEDRWIEFSRRAGEAGIGSVLSFPLVALDRSVGSLNLYSKKDQAFQDHVEIGRMFAAQAAVAIANAQTYDETSKLAHQLAEALESRAVIEQAKGILMERDGIGPDEAFQMLRRESQQSNVKLRDIARRLVDSLTPGQSDKSDG